jgi:hypothetical protein
VIKNISTKANGKVIPKKGKEEEYKQALAIKQQAELWIELISNLRAGVYVYV